MSRSKLRPLLLIVCLCAGTVACAVSTVTPFGKQVGIELEEDEKRLWKMAEQEQTKLDGGGRLHGDSVFSDYLNQVGRRLIPPNLDVKVVSFRFKTIKNPLLNAFSFPHGVIYVHSGLLAKMDNEAQLATVLAHEIAHVTHRHTLQAFRNIKGAAALMTTLQVIGAPAGLPGAGVVLLGAIGTMAAVSGYSQGAEEEADREAFDLLVRAGYDPAESPKLFDAIKKDLEERKIEEPFFFGTHPRLQDRKESFSRLLNKNPPSEPGEKAAERFEEKILPLLLENAQLDLAMGRFAFAEDALERYLKRLDDRPEGHYWLGEVYRQRAKEGDRESAEKQYLTALERDPSYAYSYKGLGLIYMKQGEKKKAREQFQIYLSLFPDPKDRGYIEQYLRELGEETTGT